MRARTRPQRVAWLLRARAGGHARDRSLALHVTGATGSVGGDARGALCILRGRERPATGEERVAASFGTHASHEGLVVLRLAHSAGGARERYARVHVTLRAGCSWSCAELHFAADGAARGRDGARLGSAATATAAATGSVGTGAKGLVGGVLAAVATGAGPSLRADAPKAADALTRRAERCANLGHATRRRTAARDVVALNVGGRGAIVPSRIDGSVGRRPPAGRRR